MPETRHGNGRDRDLALAGRRRVTLIELLAAVAILAIPFAFYAPVLRESRGVWAIVFLVVFCVHCVELVAFLFLVIAPAARWCFSRTRGTMAAGRRDDDRRTHQIVRPLLVAGPWLAVLLPIAGWADGYRVPGFIEFGAILRFLLFGYVVTLGTAVVFAINELIHRRRTAIRFVAGAGLLVLSLPCFLCYEPVYDAGARRLEHDVGLSRLAAESLALR